VLTALGREHPDMATSLNNLALLHDAYEHTEAEPLCRHRSAIRARPSTTIRTRRTEVEISPLCYAGFSSGGRRRPAFDKQPPKSAQGHQQTFRATANYVRSVPHS
jgi:hypothetical protein